MRQVLANGFLRADHRIREESRAQILAALSRAMLLLTSNWFLAGCRRRVAHFLPDLPNILERSPFERQSPLKNRHRLKWDVCEDGVINPFVCLPSDDSRRGSEVAGRDVLFPGCYQSGELPSDCWIRLIVSVKGD